MRTALLTFCAMLPLCAAAAPGSAGEARVDIAKFAFEPKEITIAPGTSVTWVNHDQTVHNVVASKGAFRSTGMDTDDRYTFRFEREGDFAYSCALHPHMTGTVHVRTH